MIFSENNQGRGKSYQPQPLADYSYSALVILNITKTETNNRFIVH